MLIITVVTTTLGENKDGGKHENHIYFISGKTSTQFFQGQFIIQSVNIHLLTHAYGTNTIQYINDGRTTNRG